MKLIKIHKNKCCATKGEHQQAKSGRDGANKDTFCGDVNNMLNLFVRLALQRVDRKGGKKEKKKTERLRQ